MNKQKIYNLAIYGVTHLLVDATCVAIIFYLLNSTFSTNTGFVNIIILYNVLAFGLQFIIGIFVDRLHAPKKTALVGCVTVVISALSSIYNPILAVILAGVGNALFHVGGGTISLNLIPRKATAPGIFVAPGAIGVLLGTLIGNGGYFSPWPLVILLSLSCVCIWLIREPEIDYNKNTNIRRTGYFEMIILLIFISIVTRSFIGSILTFPWKSELSLLVILTLAIFLGKVFGGILADKFGWRRVAVGSLLMSLPLLTIFPNVPVLAVIGMFLFNITMPITLTVISNTLPGRPGFAFGLTCFALLVGVLPIFTVFRPILNNPLVIFTAIIVSTFALYKGLSL